MYQKFQSFLGRLLPAEEHIEVISNDTWLTRQQPRVRCAEHAKHKRLIFSCAHKELVRFTQVDLWKTQHLHMVAEM